MSTPWGFGGATIPTAVGMSLGPALSMADAALGYSFTLSQYAVDAQLDVERVATIHVARSRKPIAMPSADAVISGVRRGLVSLPIAQRVLSYHGIPWGPYPAGDPVMGQLLTRRQWDQGATLWERLAAGRISRPGPDAIAGLAVRGRLDSAEIVHLAQRLDVDWGRYAQVARASYNMPAPELLLQMARLGKISPEQYRRGLQAAGWWHPEWMGVIEQSFPTLSLDQIVEAKWRGVLREGEESRYLTAAGYVDQRTLDIQAGLMYRYPGLGDITSFAVREGWDEETVRRFGYDDDFPPQLAHFAGRVGMNWGESVPLPGGGRTPLVTWPQLIWRAHWNPMPLGSAYEAFHKFRPERMARYRQQFPGLQPFTHNDLATVIKIADYPPRVRAYLMALNAPILPIQTVRLGYRLRAIEREEARQQMLDRGYVPADADIQLAVIDRQNDYLALAWQRGLSNRTNTQTVREILSGYSDGLVDQATAENRLSDLGLQLPLIRRMLALEDSRVLRQTVRAVVAQTRRAFLSGSLSVSAADESLAASQIQEPRRSQLLLRWQAQRSLERRTLATGQVSAQVAEGALVPAAGLARLINLGWVQPDANLLIQQAEAKLLQSQARAAERQARDRKARERALIAAQKSAAQAMRKAQNQLRRITSLETVRRWYCRGIRRGPWIRERLDAMGYPPSEVDSYLLQWSEECIAAPPIETPQVKGIQALLRRQTPRSVVKEWWQNGVVTDQWARRRLNDLGYTPETIDSTLASWRATLGKKPGPKATG